MILRRGSWIVFVLVALLVGACGDDAGGTTTTSTTPADLIVLDYEFVTGSQGWAADVTDFSDATRPDDVVAETGVAPPGSPAADGFLHIAATNRSDDVFLYVRHEVTTDDGVEAGAAYAVSYTIEFASNAPSGCVGVGGAPGESVWMKAGASTEQPVPIEESGDTRLSVDKGNQSSGGAAAGVAGVIANGIPCEEALSQDPLPYAMVTLQHAMSNTVQAGADGTLWLFVGIDSGFESRTSIYLDRIIARLERR
jgi:hypothetical protein